MKDQLLPQPWGEVFEPLRKGKVDDLVVVGQIGQSIDGRTATETGHSHYINGPAGLAHLHRLRALMDAVVVGVDTAIADDPQLTVRRVSGPQPVRVVIDPRARLAATARLFADDGVRRIVVTAQGAPCAPPRGVEVVTLPEEDGKLAPAAILAALANHGLHRILIEGGSDTIAGFLTACCVDRMHVVVAPVILGSGRPGFALPPIKRADEALRVPVRTHRLDDEVLFDCDFSAQRVRIGDANRST